MPTEYVAPVVEPKMVTHTVERRLSITRRTVPGTANVIESFLRRRGYFPDIEPESSLQKFAAKDKRMSGGCDCHCTGTYEPGLAIPSSVGIDS
jgi:hypothetical protein